MEKLKETTSVRQAWVLAAMLIAVSALFAYVVLPYVGRGDGGLGGVEAPDFDLPILSGGEPGARVRLSDMRRNVVVLDFWASWCGPCRDQVAVLNQLAEARLPDVRVLGVNTGEPPEVAGPAASALGASYPSALDDGTVTRSYGADALPTLVIIDRGGVVATVHQGTIDLRSLRALVDDARAQAP